MPAAARPADVPGVPYYDLLTRAGRDRVGHRPVCGPAGEPSAPEKAARLLEYAAAHGSLDNHDPGRDLDVHRLPPPARSKVGRRS